MGKELYGENFRWAAAVAQVSKKQLFDYHQRFYNLDSLWIADDDFKILSRPEYIQEKSDFDLKFLPIYGLKKIRGDRYFYLLFEGNCSNYALLYFLDWIL